MSRKKTPGRAAAAQKKRWDRYREEKRSRERAEKLEGLQVGSVIEFYGKSRSIQRFEENQIILTGAVMPISDIDRYRTNDKEII